MKETLKKKQAAVLMLAALAPTDLEKIWAAMRFTKEFTQAEIARLAGCKPHKVQDYVRNLMAAGYIAKKGETARYTRATYMLIKDVGIDAPRVRRDGSHIPTSGRTRMWNAMRILKGFTVLELANTASIPEAPIAESEAAYYCRWLANGKYIVATGKDSYRFIPSRYTGAKAPQILRVKQLLDPNTGEIVCEGNANGRDDE